MATGNCKEYLTYKRIGEIYTTTTAFSVEQKKQQKVEECLHTCYRKKFTAGSISKFSSYRECDVEELAEESFYESIPEVLNYIVTKVKDQDAQVESLFFVFYDRKLHSKIRKKKDILGINARAASGDNIINLRAVDDDNPAKEKNSDCLKQSLKKMNEKDVEIICWRHLDELSNEQIAGKLGITYPSATSRIYRCMERLRELMEKCKKN